MDEMILETERLVLRKLEQSDFREACKLLQDPEVMYAYGGPLVIRSSGMVGQDVSTVRE